MYHKNSDYKSLLYISSLHKHEIGEEWTHRWTNQLSTLCSKFHIANCIPPSTKPTKRFITLDRCTFSWTLTKCVIVQIFYEHNITPYSNAKLTSATDIS